MTRFADSHDITFAIVDRIVRALKAADWSGWAIRVSHNASGQSASRYVDLSFESEDGETATDSYCIRVSDHEARSYNRAGDWGIALIDGHGGSDAHEYLRIEPVTIEVRGTVTVSDVDDDDNLIEREEEEVEEEFAGFDLDDDAMDAVVVNAVAAVRRFFARETETA